MRAFDLSVIISQVRRAVKADLAPIHSAIQALRRSATSGRFDPGRSGFQTPRISDGRSRSGRIGSGISTDCRVGVGPGLGRWPGGRLLSRELGDAPDLDGSRRPRLKGMTRGGPVSRLPDHSICRSPVMPSETPAADLAAEIPPIPRLAPPDGLAGGAAAERGKALQRGADRGPGDDAPVCLSGGPDDRQGMPGRVVSNVRRGTGPGASIPPGRRCPTAHGEPIRSRVASRAEVGTETPGTTRHLIDSPTRKATPAMTTQPDAGSP